MLDGATREEALFGTRDQKGRACAGTCRLLEQGSQETGQWVTKRGGFFWLGSSLRVVQVLPKAALNMPYEGVTMNIIL